MIVAEISVAPISEGTSLGRFVRIAVKAIEGTGLKYTICPMGTTIEAETLDEILSAVKAAHEAVLREGAKRVVTTLKIDDRRDKDITMESKVRSARPK